MPDIGYWLPFTEGQLYNTYQKDNVDIDGTQIATIAEPLENTSVGVFTYLGVEYVVKVSASAYGPPYPARQYKIITTVYTASTGSVKWTRTDYVDRVYASPNPTLCTVYSTGIMTAPRIIGNKIAIIVVNAYQPLSGFLTDPGTGLNTIEFKVHTIDFTGVDFNTNTISMFPAVYKLKSGKYEPHYLIGGDYYYAISIYGDTGSVEWISTLVYTPRKQNNLFIIKEFYGTKYLVEDSYSLTKPITLLVTLTTTTGTAIRLGINNAANTDLETNTITGNYVITDTIVMTYGYRTSFSGGITTYYEKGLLIYNSSTGALISYDATYWNKTVILSYNLNETTSQEYVAANTSTGPVYVFVDGIYNSTLVVNSGAYLNSSALVNITNTNIFIYQDSSNYIRAVDLDSPLSAYNWVMDTGTETEYKTCVGATGDMFLIYREATILEVPKTYISGVSFRGNNLFNIDSTGTTVTTPFIGYNYLYVTNATQTLVIWKTTHTGNFWVESTFPVDDATNVAIYSPVEITFNLDPKMSTINETDLSVKIGANAYSYAKYYPGTGVVIDLKTYDDFLPNTLIDVALTADIKSNADNYDLEAYAFSFTTAAEPVGPTPDPPTSGTPAGPAGMTSFTEPGKGCNFYRKIERSSYGELDEQQFL